MARLTCQGASIGRLQAAPARRSLKCLCRVAGIECALACAGRAQGVARPLALPKAAMATPTGRSEEHTSELQSLMRISYAVFCLKKKKPHRRTHDTTTHTTISKHT